MKADYMNNTLLEKNSGFTIIEVLIAIAIFSIGILAVGSLQLSNTKNNTAGNFTTQATMLARQKIEELKTVSDVTKLTSSNPSEKVGIYTRAWNVTNPLGNDTLRHITVTVSWNRNGHREVRLDTYTKGSGL